MLFAGSWQEKTRTITLALYSAPESDLASALVLWTVMVPLSFGVLLLVRVLAATREGS